VALKRLSTRLLLCQEKLSSIAILTIENEISKEDFENVVGFVLGLFWGVKYTILKFTILAIFIGQNVFELAILICFVRSSTHIMPHFTTLKA